MSIKKNTLPIINSMYFGLFTDVCTGYISIYYVCTKLGVQMKGDWCKGINLNSDFITIKWGTNRLYL